VVPACSPLVVKPEVAGGFTRTRRTLLSVFCKQFLSHLSAHTETKGCPGQAAQLPTPTLMVSVAVTGLSIWTSLNSATAGETCMQLLAPLAAGIVTALGQVQGG
jgi:hypothetical protein